MTKPKSDEELKGLVYSLTEIPKEAKKKWYMRASTLGLLLLLITLVLNIIFF